VSNTSPFELTNRCAVVTGASNGIAQAIAIASRYVTGHELPVDGGLTINGSVGHART
jgi:NAD(P)-dependent dehydrogenase (short-subunit alcohol dehydrogenase family)